MKNRYDFDGDGIAEIPVASPWGIGILKLSKYTLDAPMMIANGNRFGGWLLDTKENHFSSIADFDGDSRAEILVISPGGIGILKLSGSTLAAPMVAPNGTRFGGWLLNTEDNQFGPVGDFDGDGRAEILVSSPWGIGILKLSGSTLVAPMMAPNGTRFGGWLLNTKDNRFGPVGDFDGDGRTEILAISPWGIGILKLSGNTLVVSMMAPNGTRFGNWNLDTGNNRFGPVGDFDGDGKTEILVTSPWGIGVLKLSGNTLTSSMLAPNGTRFGGWLLNTEDNQFGPAGNFDSDGKTEILVTSPWGIGVLKLSGNTFTASMLAPNGTRFDDLILNTENNRFNIAADFDGDGKTEILATSPKGIGILKFSGSTFKAVVAKPNGTRFGNWLLNTADDDLELANWNAHALIIYHEGWLESVNQLKSVLQRRGYRVYTTDSGSVGLSLIKEMSQSLKKGDRLLVYLAGHGSDPRAGRFGNMDKAICLDHFVQFNKGELYVKQISPLFKKLGDMGIDLNIIDGSCNGGETVYNAIGEKYCAVSTTGVYSPGLVNFPNPSGVMQKAGKPGTFGLWWAKPNLTSSWLNGAVICNTPFRLHQRLYRNDKTDFTKLSLFSRTAVDSLKILDLGGWNLHYCYCNLYEYIYPNDYKMLSDKEKQRFTNDTKSYISSMNNIMDPQRPIIDMLRGYLNNETLMDKASLVYSNAFVCAWQTLVGDDKWDPISNPSEYSKKLYGISPKSYTGTNGFKAIKNELLYNITMMERFYKEQESLLWKIDYAIKRRLNREFISRKQMVHMSNILIKSSTEISLPAQQNREIQELSVRDPAYYQLYNEHEREFSNKLKEIYDKVNVESPEFVRVLPNQASGIRMFEKDSAEKIIAKSIELYRGEFKTEMHISSDLEDLIQQFKAISVEHFHLLGRSSFFLSFIEDSVCKVQSEEMPCSNPGDINFY